MFKQYQLKNYNFRLIVLVLALSIMGILVIGSAKESSQIKQIIGLGLSLVVMVVASLVDYTWLLKLQWLMYAGSIAILAAVYLFRKSRSTVPDGGLRSPYRADLPAGGAGEDPDDPVFCKIFHGSSGRAAAEKPDSAHRSGTGGAAFASRAQSSRTFPRPSA